MKYRNEKLEPYVEGEPYFVIDAYNTKYWYNVQGQCHRTDGPAIECANGIKSWWFQGLRHREDGPAIECANGSKEWYFQNQLHREDGPAREFASGYKAWYIEGKNCIESEYEAGLEAYFIRNGKKSRLTLQREAEEEKRREYWRTVEMPGGIQLH